jgi:hypothetical protein
MVGYDHFFCEIGGEFMKFFIIVIKYFTDFGAINYNYIIIQIFLIIALDEEIVIG